VQFGYFLVLREGTLACQPSPAYWQMTCEDCKRSLVCTTDTPVRRQHYRLHCQTQSLDYARRSKNQYCCCLDNNNNNNNDSPRMSLRTALDRVQALPADPFGPGDSSCGSLRTLAFQSAECVRSLGHPDWVQLVALVYYLGRVHSSRNEKTDAYDWTIASRSWVLGCPVPDNPLFGEFQSLRPDPDDNCKYEAHCGLENVVLAWTGPEYMYHMLQRNSSSLPKEGLAMLRLASLIDWHSGCAYTDLENQDDKDLKSFVAEFDKMLATARKQSPATKEMSNDECDLLWKSHYSDIAAKYNVSGELQW